MQFVVIIVIVGQQTNNQCLCFITFLLGCKVSAVDSALNSDLYSLLIISISRCNCFDKTVFLSLDVDKLVTDKPELVIVIDVSLNSKTVIKVFVWSWGRRLNKLDTFCVHEDVNDLWKHDKET